MEYTRPLLLFGVDKNPACIDLFRLFYESPSSTPADKAEAVATDPPPKSVRDLRWEFEFTALGSDEVEVKVLSERLGVGANAGIDGKPPVLASLNDDGSVAATYPLQIDASGSLDALALSAFLAEQALPTRDANQMLADARAKAKAENKRVFLILSASWCGPCRLLARFLAAHKAELEPHYVFVKLDISRDTHADEFSERYQTEDAYGVPWFAILDPENDDKVLADCNSESSQVEV